MAKSNYLKTWKDAKKSFESATNSKKPSPKTVQVLGVTIRKGSGIEKALADFDAAVNKGHRKDANLYYQTAWKVCGEYPHVLNSAISAVKNFDDPIVGELQMLVAVLSKIVSDMSKTLGDLQKEKGKAVPMQAFYADFEQELNNYEKATKASKMATDAEKTYKLVAVGKKCLKPLKDYTVASSRSDAVKAKTALVEFSNISKLLESNALKVHSLVGGLNGYGPYATALKRYGDFSANLRKGRVQNAVNQLTKIISEG